MPKAVKVASVYVLLRGPHNGTAYFSDVSLATATGPAPPTMLRDGAIRAMPDGSVVVTAAAPAPTALAVQATFEGLDTHIRVTGSITRTDAGARLNPRAVSLSLSVPLNASGWLFAPDPNTETQLGPADNAVGLQYQNPNLPHPTDYYPFLALHDQVVGITAGVAVDGPVFVSRTVYLASRLSLTVTADFALTPNCTLFPNTANFSFVFFRLQPPLWGFRAALERYYSLYPSFSEPTPAQQGLWMVPTLNLSAIANHSDFGFRFDEGGGSASECRQLSGEGVDIFPYIEPHLVHWSLPRNSTIDYEHILASINACSSSSSCTQLGKARAILKAGVLDAHGQLRWRPEDAAWNFGAVLWVDLDPRGRHDRDNNVAHIISTVQKQYAKAAAGNYTLGGIYVDSVANAQEKLNYRASTLRDAHYPPVFDKHGKPAVLMLQNTLAFLNYLRDHVLAYVGSVWWGGVVVH